MSVDRPLPSAEEVWRRYDAIESRLSAALSERMLDLAGLQPGMRVLDLAIGRGEPALRAARRVGPQGMVLGVEPSEAILEMARERAKAEPERVPYFTLPRRLLQRYRSPPALDPEAPGTFRYSDPGRIVRDFSQAGFCIEHMEEMDIAVFETESSAELIAWVRAFGLTRLLNGLGEEEKAAWEKDLKQEMEGRRAGGLMRLGGVSRIVCARACGECADNIGSEGTLRQSAIKDGKILDQLMYSLLRG